MPIDFDTSTDEGRTVGCLHLSRVVPLYIVPTEICGRSEGGEAIGGGVMDGLCKEEWRIKA